MTSENRCYCDLVLRALVRLRIREISGTRVDDASGLSFRFNPETVSAAIADPTADPESIICDVVSSDSSVDSSGGSSG